MSSTPCTVYWCTGIKITFLEVKMLPEIS